MVEHEPVLTTLEDPPKAWLKANGYSESKYGRLGRVQRDELKLAYHYERDKGRPPKNAEPGSRTYEQFAYRPKKDGPDASEVAA